MRMMGEWPAFQKLRRENPKLFAGLTPDLPSLMKQARERWLVAAEKALERNTTTFSMLTINDVLDKDGLVAQLEAKGYKVEISAE
jgi:flavin-binding protein dodecin